MAELKPMTRRMGELEAARFHGVKAVAELKHYTWVGDPATAGPGFHGVKAVAELKRPSPS